MHCDPTAVIVSPQRMLLLEARETFVCDLRLVGDFFSVYNSGVIHQYIPTFCCNLIL